jgi:TonB family protein
MKIILIFLVLVSSSICYSQKTKKVVNKINKWSDKKEVYFVLATNKQIKNGSYKIIVNKDEELVSGFYKMGLKDSLWIEYRRQETTNGKIKKSEGSYFNDQKVGVWKFYDNKGKISQEYDFTNKKVLFSTTLKNVEFESLVIIDNDTMKVLLDSPVDFIGTYEALFQHVATNLMYPQHAIENGLSGKVNVTFCIDTNGIASGHFVKDQVGNGLDEAALQAVLKIPNDWIPAVYKGKPVKTIIKIPVNFTLN